MAAILALILLVTAACGPLFAQRWEASEDGFVLRLGQERIRYRAPGNLWAGRADGPGVDAALFLWHDAWIYERLDGGTAESGPEVDERGWLRQRGTWVTREGAPPMRYSLALEPTPTGAVLHLETEKTAPLKLTAGLWATLSLDRRAFTAGQRLYARPVAHGRIGRPVTGVCEALLVELAPGQAVSFAGENFGELRSHGGENSQIFELNLRPGDFAVGEKATATLKIAFEAMPAQFPGTIHPGREKLALAKVTPSARVVPRYEKLELAVDLRATFDNPFDPDDVALDAQVTTASGRRYTQPGFFMVRHRRVVRGGVELMTPVDHGGWYVRLAATEPGPLRVRLVARDRTGTVSRNVGPFQVQASRAKGFLRPSRVDPRYLQFDSGAPFVPVGHNVPIYHTTGQTGIDAIRKMAANGENFNRWWLSNAGLGLEWEDRVGWYRQATAARLDLLLDLAAQLDFYYMLCLDTHQDFREGGWQVNPYRRANGGPCDTVADWFTNEAARALYRKRLRYTVARWGYSPNVLCWEFGNEFEGWADTPEETKITWHREMAAYLAKLDPYRHLITSSWWSHTGPEACWRIPEIDLVQTHCYTNNDANVAEQVRQFCLHQWQTHAKPHLFGEFGIRSHDTTEDKDPSGWSIHNANWAALCSGCVGIPMPWWHENYIDPLNLYFHFTAIARFAKGLPFGTERWQQVPVGPLEYVEPPTQPLVRDVVLTPVARWGKPAANEFVVQPDGSINDPQALHDLLQGMGHQELRNPPTFVVNYPRPGRFTLTVGRVSNSGLLRIWLDGALKLERAYPCGEGHGKQWQYQPQWDLWESVYDEEVSIEVPAGQHRITVDNLGKDWMRIGRYVFTGCQVIERPDLLVAALRAPSVAIVWIQNRESDWYNHRPGGTSTGGPTLVPPARVALSGFPDGAYQVEWWETWHGRPTHTERVTAQGGRLILVTDELTTDVAAKIRPVKAEARTRR